MNNDILTLALIGLVIWLVIKQQQPTQVTNAETWSWIDWQGNQRSITVERDVKACG